ncbi:MAG: hypothetical protein A2081_04620 [Elusimicrobia bacterium GWC2_61_19]|nr:MAG: hypothetical protein A2081_04620 [Elusimicrobia bacterium GWC2_61_19]
MKKLPNYAPLVMALLLAAAQGCGRKPGTLPPGARLETYSFNVATSLEDRIIPVPAALLEYFRKEDKKPGYAAYVPTPEDKALVVAYLRLLPPVYERILAERCVGIYFIEGLIGNGVTSWVIGPGDEVYFYIVLNPAGLRDGLSVTLTERERSCFVPRAGWDVLVDGGTKYKGLLYSLFHEATHGLDYAEGISPYTDDTMPHAYWPERGISDDFFFNTWNDYSKPREGAGFPGRDRITFYGLGGGPKLDITEAPALYKGLGGSGFASLYGARTWAEDLAELATFDVLTRKLGQPYLIFIQTPAGVSPLEPMRGTAGVRAAEVMEYLEEIK